MTDQLAARYEGTEPFPDAGGQPRTVAGGVRVAVTLAIVIVPFAGLGVAVWLAWGHGLRLADVLLATAFYLVTGLGVTRCKGEPMTTTTPQHYDAGGTAARAPAVDTASAGPHATLLPATDPRPS